MRPQPTASGLFLWADHMGQRRRADKRIRGRKGQQMRARRLRAASGLCVDCRAAGRVRAADVIDHIIPLALGGMDIDSNCRALCDDCHHKRTAEQFGHKQKVEIGSDGWPVE